LKSAYQQHAAVTAETPFASWVVADMAKQAAAAFTDDGEEQEHICEPSMCDHRAGPRQGWELTRSGPGSTSIWLEGSMGVARGPCAVIAERSVADSGDLHPW